MKTRSFIATPLLIGLLLSGCNLVGELLNNGNLSNSSAFSENNHFANTNFPLEYCGDSLPEDPKTYPIELYTVFIDRIDEIEERNFKLIQDEYCQQALSFMHPNEGTQLATFTSREKAEQFKEIVSKDLENVQISEPEIIRELSENQSSITESLETSKKLETTEEIAQAALLSEAQMQELLAIDGSETSWSSDKYTLKVVVPTYIPKGFELTRFDVRQQVDYGNGSDYYLEYKNPMNNQCFSFREGYLQGAGGASLSAVVNANSRALGLAPIARISSVKMGDRVSYVGFYYGVLRGKTSDN